MQKKNKLITVEKTKNTAKILKKNVIKTSEK
jgi:hypothetical protein